MKSAISDILPNSPIYKKAIEIFSISRNISSCLNDDLASLNDNNQDDESIYFTGDIVQQSVCLAPEILKAEQEKFSEEKYKYVASIDRLATLLYKNCERLEKVNANAKDFLPVLKSEIIKFRKLKRTWMMTL